MMLAPVRYNYATVEMLTVDPIDLAAAIERDAPADGVGATSGKAK